MEVPGGMGQGGLTWSDGCARALAGQRRPRRRTRSMMARATAPSQVAALGMPPPERRADSLQALQGLDFFGGEAPDERQLLAWEVRRPALAALPAA